jgi:hypothetical protein
MYIVLAIVIGSLLQWFFFPSKRSAIVSGTPTGNLVAASILLLLLSAFGLFVAVDTLSKFKTTATVSSTEQEFCYFFNKTEKTKTLSARVGQFWQSSNPIAQSFEGYTVARCADRKKIDELIAQGWMPADDYRLIHIVIRTESGGDANSTLTLPTQQVSKLKVGDQLDVWAQAHKSYTSRRMDYFVHQERFKITGLTLFNLALAIFAMYFFAVSLRKYRNAKYHPNSIT